MCGTATGTAIQAHIHTRSTRRDDAILWIRNDHRTARFTYRNAQQRLRFNDDNSNEP